MGRKILEDHILDLLQVSETPLCKHDFRREFGADVSTVERALAKLRNKNALRVAKWHRQRRTGPYTPYYTLADGTPDEPMPILGRVEREAQTPPSDPLTMLILRQVM